MSSNSFTGDEKMGYPGRSASFDGSAFCSAYLQPVTYIDTYATTSVSSTYTVVTRTTTFTTATTTDIRVSTATALCPTPSASMTCGAYGLGNSNNLIANYEPLNPEDCHQLCLHNTTCKSFQVVNDNGYTRCNLYNSPAAGIIFNDPSKLATFYDRDCGDFLPTGCTATPAAQTTTAPSLANAAIQERELEKRTYTYPYFLSINPEYMVFVCSCVVTSPSPTSTVHQTFLIPIYSTTSVTSVQTNVLVSSEHPNWSTVYTSVS
ncbi:hypothetical protein LSUE1_G007361 [Lachnellula suecica]|uniref:Apple domain-containing protein n=1 Tax=Lachnellula suecica TaxID=602035 RepID=A0A8T9C650_9HELO|nr:hypothetical protein LSUE1_G007361 [Lachnellula suecica]